MIKEAIDRILSLSAPNFQKFGALDYSDKSLHLIAPPVANPIGCSTLQGLADLINEKFDDLIPEEVFLHIDSPTRVDLLQNASDPQGRIRVWASAKYPEIAPFPFGTWLDPENFIIKAQQGFQRVKVQNEDGSFARDLDYVLGVASNITAEHRTPTTGSRSVAARKISSAVNTGRHKRRNECRGALQQAVKQKMWWSRSSGRCRP